MDLSVINFGLGIDALNWKLMQFMTSDDLSKLPLKDYQIDALADRLNWDIMSSKELPGWIFVKYKDRIDWCVFLQNGHPKDASFLAQVKDKLQENNALFFSPHNKYIKEMYYSDMFLSEFPEFVDWNWCAKNMQLDDYVLLKHWGKMNINTICKYQQMSEVVMREKMNYIKWKYASKHPMSEEFMREFYSAFDWLQISKYQKLSCEFITEFKHLCSAYHISRYQTLDEKFILDNLSWLDKKALSEFQNLSMKFIKDHHNILSMENMQKNRNYNKPDTLQVICNHSRWYIIDDTTTECFKI